MRTFARAAGVQTIVLRLAFDGTAFSGSQRQPDRRTVDGDLLTALAKVGADVAGFRPASRTDAGVSAAGYVVAIETAFRPEALAPAVNAGLRDAWVTHWAEAPQGFDPRRAATQRSYRYFLADEGVDAARVHAALQTFVGEHDFSAFARIEEHRSPRRTVSRVGVTREGGAVAIDVEGPSFLWNQVRRMVAAALAHARGEVSLEEIRDALATGRGRDLGLAPPEGLVLSGIDVGLTWVPCPPGGAELSRAAAAERARLRVRGAVLSALAGPLR